MRVHVQYYSYHLWNNLHTTLLSANLKQVHPTQQYFFPWPRTRHVFDRSACSAYLICKLWSNRNASKIKITKKLIYIWCKCWGPGLNVIIQILVAYGNTKDNRWWMNTDKQAHNNTSINLSHSHISNTFPCWSSIQHTQEGIQYPCLFIGFLC